ncbi:hypothetical protein CSB11_01380 [Candidatus Campbellbacteria bacterium]|nr:MAG: hypothetical protein CSB11_01380 [Candidatus Campbellbacteria bacterium]
MLILLSPAKTLDFKTKPFYNKGENIIFPKETLQIIKQIKNFSVLELKELMHISDNIAQLNYKRFQKYNSSYKNQKQDKNQTYNFKQAIFAFAGDVYDGFDFLTYTKKDFQSLNKQVLILSGLYGVLTPLTFIKPYRLEMGTKFLKFQNKFSRKNLYQFWGNKVTDQILKKLQRQKKEERFILNLASQEYFKVLDKKQIQEFLIDVDFKVLKNNKLTTVAIYAKKQRGEMTNWIIKNNILNLKDLKKYKNSGFKYSAKNSTNKKLVFVKKMI